MWRLVLLVFVSLTVLRASGHPLRLDPEGAHSVELKDLGNGEWEVRTTGDDPYFRVVSEGGALDLEKTARLALEVVTRITGEMALISLAVAATALGVALLLRREDAPLVT